MINTQTISYPFGHNDLQTKIAYGTNGLPEYIGRSRPGAADTAAEWQICKCGYDSAGRLTSILFAAGVNDYTKVWNSRTGYSY